MSTTLKIFQCRVHPRYECELYRGMGGVCIFIKDSTTEEGLKFWLKAEDIPEFIVGLEAGRGAYSGNASNDPSEPLPPGGQEHAI